MTDKDKIRAEVERLYEVVTKDYSLEGVASAAQLHKILVFIDSLSEEPVNKDLEEVAEGIYDCNDIESWICFDGLVEPISKVGEKVKVIIIKEEEK